MIPLLRIAPVDSVAVARKAAGQPLRMLERALAMPVLTDLDARLRLMDRFPGYRQIPCLVSPPLETLAGPEQAAELARRANDGMAAMAARHPDRFPDFFAALALNHPEAMLTEARRALTELGACGVQIFSNHYYTDTATFGSAAAVECALKFFGLERVLFATDMPFGPEQGAAHIRDTIANVSALPLNAVEREAVLHRNAERLLIWKK